MKIGLTYDLREEYLAMGYDEEETAEFDRGDTIDAIEQTLQMLGYRTDRIGHAKNLAREGWTKGDIKEFISEFKRISGSQFNSMPVIGGFKPGLFKGRITPQETDTIPVIRNPEYIRIIVAGGPGAFIAHAVGGGATPGKKQTQKIELPENWDSLVARYKNVVPTYAKY